MSQPDTPFARLVGVLKSIPSGSGHKLAPASNSHYHSQQVPGGPFVSHPGPAKLTLGKGKCPRQAALEAGEPVTLFGSHGSGVGTVQDSLVAQQIARDGAYIFLDVALDYDRQDLLAHLHTKAETSANFQVLNADDPDNSHTYNPLVRGTAKAVAERIVSALINDSFEKNQLNEVENLIATAKIAALIQALRDCDGVAQFKGLHNALESVEGFERLLSSTKIHPATRIELDRNFAACRTSDGLAYDLEKIQQKLGRLLRLLPWFSSGKIGQVVNVTEPEIDLLDGLNTQKGLFMMLPTLGKNMVALALGRLVMADLRDALEEKRTRARGTNQPSPLVVTAETPCLSDGHLLQTFAAAKGAGVTIVSGVSSTRNLEAMTSMDRHAVLHNEATKVFFQANARETPEELDSFGRQLAMAGASWGLPGLMASRFTVPVGEGFIVRGVELTHLAAWPKVEVPGYLERYKRPERQAHVSHSSPEKSSS